MKSTPYVFTTLAQRPTFYAETISLIECSFEYAAPNKFDIDFATLMSPLNHENCHLFIINNKVVGHIGVKLRKLGTSEFFTPVALIGGIAIHKDYRGQGLFKELFNQIINKYTSNYKISMFILWSNLDSLYKKFNFFQAGAQIQTGELEFDEKKLPAQFKRTLFINLTHKQFKQIKEIYTLSIEKLYTTFIRDDSAWHDIQESTSTDLYLYYVDDKISGYFCVNKGQDLKSIIHEYACLPQFKQKFLDSLQGFKLWLPEHENIQYQKQHLFYTAIFKINDLTIFNKFLKSWSHNECSISQVNDDTIIFVHDGKEFQTTHGSFYTYLFGPSKITEFQDYGRPLYFSGLDSI